MYPGYSMEAPLASYEVEVRYIYTKMGCYIFVGKLDTYQYVESRRSV